MQLRLTSKCDIILIQGFTFVIIFSLFQISTITCLFMVVSTNVSSLYEEEWQRHMLTMSFLIFSIYYTGSLYVITITAENGYNDLKQLVDPLRQKLGIKDQNKSEIKNRFLGQVTEPRQKNLIELKLKELDDVRPFSGNGYFEIGRGTLTSIVSTSITYFIILLQFKQSE